jgi:hypothetical protein
MLNLKNVVIKETRFYQVVLLVGLGEGRQKEAANLVSVC